mmetsp:Transcript_125248/g.400346  ORF Transcript_125248/g.400346 Transcript_125248/m.400346 type:complete len:269 (-) Transcript_125248:598-1404(-)
MSSRFLRAALLGAALVAHARAALGDDVALSEAVLDDACLAGQDAEECALSLRQLRGVKTLQEVSSHDPEEGEDEPDSTAEPAEEPATTRSPAAEASNGTSGFCCYSGETSDTCGSCYPTAMANEGDYCANKNQCGGCGGTWCTMQCVYSASDKNDPCNTAYPTAIAAETDYCGAAESRCTSTACKGWWCVTKDKDAPPPVPHNNTGHEGGGHHHRRRRRGSTTEAPEPDDDDAEEADTTAALEAETTAAPEAKTTAAPEAETTAAPTA